MKKIIVHFKKEEFERVKNAISILAKFSEIYAPHIDKANSILSFRVDELFLYLMNRLNQWNL